MNFAALRLIIVLLVLTACIPAALFFWEMPMAPSALPEKELMNFTDSLKAAIPPSPQASYAGLDCPVQPPPVKGPAVVTVAKSFPPGPIPEATAAAPAAKPQVRDSFHSSPNVSMIYCEGSTKTAIIDGQVLHEGSRLGKSLVVQIEKARVLLRTAGKDVWLNVEQ